MMARMKMDYNMDKLENESERIHRSYETKQEWFEFVERYSENDSNTLGRDNDWRWRGCKWITIWTNL